MKVLSFFCRGDYRFSHCSNRIVVDGQYSLLLPKAARKKTNHIYANILCTI